MRKLPPEKTGRPFGFDEVFSRLESTFNLRQGVLGEVATRELKALSDDCHTLRDRVMILLGLERIGSRRRHRAMATKPKSKDPQPKI
jgi:hypothetical protein